MSGRSGSPLNVTSGVDGALNGQANQHANHVSDDVHGGTLNTYLKPSAFAQPVPGTFGNYVRNSLRGPAFWNIDLSLSRVISLTTSQSLELRLETFNLLNHFNWGNPGTNFSAGTFGRILSQSGSPRIMQCGVKELDMNLKYLVVVVAFVTISATQPLSAHHSVPVNFDTSKEATINGVLTEIKWVNPHAHWRINVTQPDGTILEWLVEMGATNTMKRAGFPMDKFMIGDTYTVIGSPGRRDRSILLEEVIFPDGTRMTPTMRPRDPSNRNQG